VCCGSWTLRRSGGVIDPAAVSWIGTTIELANVQLWLQLGFEFPQNGRETPLVSCGVGMVGAKVRFADCQGAFVKGSGAGQVTLVALDPPKGVEAGGSAGVVGAKVGLADGQGALMMGAGPPRSPR
jgi:hypothetical protein